jgi:glycosyltransferase involved in cell wall biosynthesis
MRQGETVFANPRLATPTDSLMDDVSRDPLVSVLVPLFNQAHFVSECLDSIAQSHYPNLEIVVINDASTDDSHDVVQRWREKNTRRPFKYLQHSVNCGVCKTLNDGLQIAEGEFIALLASDDVLLANGIRDRVTFLNEHPDKLAVFGDCHVIDILGAKMFESGILEYAHMPKELLQIDELILYVLVFDWALPGPGFMARREMYRQVGFYDEELPIDDWDMYLRVAATGHLGFLPMFVAKYRVHPKSMVRNDGDRVKAGVYKTARKNRSRCGWLACVYLWSFSAEFHARVASTRLRRIAARCVSFVLNRSARLIYYCVCKRLSCGKQTQVITTEKSKSTR